MKNTIILTFLLQCTLTTQAQSIEDILSNVEKNNIQLQAAQKEIEAQNAEINQQNAVEGLSVEYSPFIQKGIKGIQSTELIVKQDFDFPTIYAQRKKMSHTQRKTLQLEYLTLRRNILLQAKLKCLLLVQLAQLNAILSGRLQQSTQLLSLYNKRLQCGDATLLEVNKLKTELMSIRTELATNKILQNETTQQLLALNANKPLQTNLLTYPTLPSKIKTDSLLQQLVQSDVAIQSVANNQTLAKQQVQLNKQLWLPRLSVGYRRNTEGSMASNGILVGFTLPLYSNKNKMKAAKAELESAQLKTTLTQLNIENQLNTKLLTLSHLHETLAAFNLPLMKQSLQLLQKSLTAGQISILNYYTEVHQLYAKWKEYIDVEFQYQSVYAEIMKNKL